MASTAVHAVELLRHVHQPMEPSQLRQLFLGANFPRRLSLPAIHGDHSLLPLHGSGPPSAFPLLRLSLRNQSSLRCGGLPQRRRAVPHQHARRRHLQPHALDLLRRDPSDPLVRSSERNSSQRLAAALRSAARSDIVRSGHRGSLPHWPRRRERRLLRLFPHASRRWLLLSPLIQICFSLQPYP